MANNSKHAEGPVVNDESLAYDSTTAPVAVHEPGVGKAAQHPNTHFPDSRGSTAKHVKHTHPLARGRNHTPEDEKKGGIGHHDWGSHDPQEVLIDETGNLPVEDFLKPESKEQERAALQEATQPDAEDKKVMTLEEYEKKTGAEV